MNNKISVSKKILYNSYYKVISFININISFIYAFWLLYSNFLNN